MCYVRCSQSKTSKSCQEKPPLHPCLIWKHRTCPTGSDLLVSLSPAVSETLFLIQESTSGWPLQLIPLFLSQQMLSLGSGFQRFIPVSVFSICLGLVVIFSKPVFHVMIPSVLSPQPPMATIEWVHHPWCKKIPFSPAYICCYFQWPSLDQLLLHLLNNKCIPCKHQVSQALVLPLLVGSSLFSLSLQYNGCQPLNHFSCPLP